jgi:hypothetical protein
MDPATMLVLSVTSLVVLDLAASRFGGLRSRATARRRR